MQWSTALPDWRERIVGRKSLAPCSPLFPDEAEAASRIFRSLRLVDVPGSPRIGEVSRPWVFDLPEAIFGAYDAETGRRLINEFFMLISKKNSKSSTAAGIMLTALLRNWRQSAEFIILAPTIEIANNSAGPAMDMVRHGDQEMRDLLRPVPHQRLIQHRTTGATLKIVAADSEVVSGKKASGVLIEELWLFGKKPDADNMLREATGGLASRPEGFVVALSTMSDQPPAGVFKQWLDRYRDIRDGKLVDPHSLGLLYEFPEQMVAAEDYKQPELFYVTNPNLGASVDEEYLRREMDKAERAGPGALAGFYAKHLNIEIGLRLRSDRWTGADFWEQAAEPALTLDDLLARSEVVTIGIDGGGLDDLLGLSVVGRETETGRWLLWTRAWAHQSALEQRKSEAPRYKDFASDGDLVIVEAIDDDMDDVADIVEKVEASGKLDRIGVDVIGVGGIVDAITGRGIDLERIVGIPQGYKLSSTIKTAERKLAGRNLVHGGQAMMAWCVSNAKVEPKGNAILITKQASGTGKIDPLMAAFDAIALMATNPASRAPQAVWL